MSTKTETVQPSEPSWVKLCAGKKVDIPWWIENIDDRITPEIRHFLETYSRVPPEQVREHIYTTREKAWAIRGYPCTGLAAWLRPNISNSPVYDTILARLKNGASLMDIGCFIGHDLRRLVADGAPSDKLYGVDIVNHWDLGYDFFRDRDRFGAHFLEDDIWNPGAGLRELSGTIDVINLVYVLHLMDFTSQLRAGENICALSRPGTIITGLQCGTTGSNQLTTEDLLKMDDHTTFWQSPATWETMWDMVGKRTGTVWECQVQMSSWEGGGWDAKDLSFMPVGTQLLHFVVTRTA